MSNIENKEISSTISETPTPVKDKLVTAESLKLVSDIAKANRTETTKLKEDLSELSGQIPHNTSELTNDSDYQTGEQVRAEIGKMTHYKFEKADSLEDVTEENVIYLIPNEESKEDNIFDEYLLVDGVPELIGSTAIDLSNYALKEEIPTVPEKLPNPNPLTFTGAVTGSYDGSEAVNIDIPISSGGGDEKKVIYNQVLTENVGFVSVPFSEFSGCKRIICKIYIPKMEEETYKNYLIRIKLADTEAWSSGAAFAYSKDISTNTNHLLLMCSMFIVNEKAHFENMFYMDQYTKNPNNLINAASVQNLGYYLTTQNTSIYFEINNRTYLLPIGTEITILGY